MLKVGLAAALGLLAWGLSHLKRSGGGFFSGGGNGWLDLCVELVAEFEGFEPTVAPDPIGIPTVGYGHVWQPGDPQTVTEAQAKQWLREELRDDYGPSAFSALAARGYVPETDLSDAQKAALVSFAYNLGPGCVSSASWPVKWKAGQKEAAAASWKAHNKAGGGVLPGLVRRRFTEWKLWETGVLDFQPEGWQEYYENS